MPAAEGLFRGAVSVSGAVMRPQGRDLAETVSALFTSRTGVPATVAALRGLTDDELLDLQDHLAAPSRRGAEGPARQLALKPGERAYAGLVRRNTVEGGTPVNAPYARAWAKPGAAPVTVIPELDLGTTGRLGVGPWKKEEERLSPSSGRLRCA